VFVNRPMPWPNFAQSFILHIGAISFFLATANLWLGQPRLLSSSERQRVSIGYIPQIDSGDAPPAKPAPMRAKRQGSLPAKADPELSEQEVISVPAHADNSQ